MKTLPVALDTCIMDIGYQRCHLSGVDHGQTVAAATCEDNEQSTKGQTSEGSSGSARETKILHWWLWTFDLIPRKAYLVSTTPFRPPAQHDNIVGGRHATF
jgi:hypothetical protein